MKPVAPLADCPHTDMSPEAIDQRLRDLAQIYKLGMSLRGAQWLGPVNGQEPASVPTSADTICGAVPVAGDSPLIEESKSGG